MKVHTLEALVHRYTKEGNQRDVTKCMCPQTQAKVQIIWLIGNLLIFFPIMCQAKIKNFYLVFEMFFSP